MEEEEADRLLVEGSATLFSVGGMERDDEGRGVNTERAPFDPGHLGSFTLT